MTKYDGPVVPPLAEAQGRLSMSRAFVQFLLKAYDALLHHGVNYRTLPEWQDSKALDDIDKVPFDRGVEKTIVWMGRLGNALDAAVRRKGFTVVPKE